MYHIHGIFEEVQTTTKQTVNCITNRTMKTILATFQKVFEMIVWWIAVSQRPPRKPPRWPYQSMLEFTLEGVKISTKKNIVMAEQQSWHFMTGPSRSTPFQFRIMYPRITPIMPKRAVEAPALRKAPLFMASLKMLPEMPESRQMHSALGNPRVYSILDTRKKVLRMLPKKCSKLTCIKMADTSLHSSTLFLRGGQQFEWSIRVVDWTSSRLLDSLAMPWVIQKMKTPKSAITNRNVKEQKLNWGHSPNTSISQQVSSLGFLRLLLPDTKSTRC